jgi:hypothetical protein
VSVSSGLQGGSTEGEATTTHEEPTGYGPAVSSQFLTALTHWPNVSVADWGTIQANNDGSYSTKMNPGEVGPFIIRGVVTEFNETAQASGANRSVSLGAVGAGLAAFGIRGGSILAAVNPEYKSEKQVRQGTVSVDLTLLDGRNGRVIRAYNCSGTFTTQSATNGMSILGIGGGNAQFAASALGQATRAAMNDAVQKTADALRMAPR